MALGVDEVADDLISDLKNLRAEAIREWAEQHPLFRDDHVLAFSVSGGGQGRYSYNISNVCLVHDFSDDGWIEAVIWERDEDGNQKEVFSYIDKYNEDEAHRRLYEFLKQARTAP